MTVVKSQQKDNKDRNKDGKQKNLPSTGTTFSTAGFSEGGDGFFFSEGGTLGVQDTKQEKNTTDEIEGTIH